MPSASEASETEPCLALARAERNRTEKTALYDDGAATSDRAMIAIRATRRNSLLFFVADEDEDKFVDTYTRRTCDLGEHHMSISARMVHTATVEARRGRAHPSSDMTVAEMWQSAAGELQVGTAPASRMTWAMHKRLENSSAR